ncbi:uncharacterized protein LOC143286093 [Babylonia areolata]|uniref:uncharacterized protein LOC143286093 n=1 Tax=Babylonia areolata TaxID=304850 RepID=UPI003FD358D1
MHEPRQSHRQVDVGRVTERKKENMATSFGTEEFRIDTNKKTLVEKHSKKVERLFGVKVAFDMVLVDGDTNNQWLVVSGNKENRQKAMRYIQSMCDPEQTTSLKVSGQPALDDAVLEEVERTSLSFIQRTGSLTLQVMGSDLKCTLAVSQLEQTYRVTVTGIKMADQGADHSASKPRTQVADVSPSEVVDGVKGMAMDSCDGPHPHHHSPEDLQLFGLGTGTPAGPSHHQTSTQAAQSPGKKIIRPKPAAASGTMAKSPVVAAGSSSIELTGRGRGGGGASSQIDRERNTRTPKTLSPRQLLRDRGGGEEEKEEGGRGVEPVDGSELSADGLKQKSELMSLALGMGYTPKEIEDTCSFFDFSQHTIMPHHFLTAVDEVRATRVKEDKKGDVPCHAWGAEGGKRSEAATPAAHNNKGKQKLGKGKQGKKGGGGGGGSPGERVPTSRNSPAANPMVVISPEKIHPSTTDNSVIVVGGEEGNDSVIYVGSEEGESNDSVCVVDPWPEGHLPGGPRRPILRAAKKRKDYSDDEDQTKVLKPYYPSPTKEGSGALERRQGFQQPAEAAAVAGANSEVTGNKDNSDLRFIVVDGSNVAMSHGNGKEFSCRGIKICVEHFVSRGHRVKAWVPLTKTYQNKAWLRHPPVTNQEILEELKERGLLGYTPARTLNHKHIVCYDDHFILELAKREDAVVVSNDNFREFNDEYAFIVENRVLSYVFSDDHFLLPSDPLGRYGPTLEQFLRKTPNSQAGAAEGSSTARAPFPHQRQPYTQRPPNAQGRGRGQSQGQGRPKAMQDSGVWQNPPAAMASSSVQGARRRHEKVTQQLFEALKGVFPEKDQEARIRQVLENHRAETDLNKLTNYCIAALSLQ